VISLEEKVNAGTATFKDSFVDIVPSSFSFVCDGSVDGKRIWRVITKATSDETWVFGLLRFRPFGVARSTRARFVRFHFRRAG
jgi:hypothetical protein